MAPADLRRVRKGQRVFKTSDPAIERELRQSFSGTVPRFKQPVTIEVCGRPGVPLRIEMSDTEGRIVTVLDHAPAEAASERPLDDEVLKAQLGRLGDTPFRLERLHSAFEAPVHVPFSRLNELRRRCVAELLDLRAAAVERTERSSSIGEVRETLGGGARAAGESAPTLSVLCRTIEQVEAAIECGVQTIFTDFEDIRLHKAAREIIPRGTVRFVPATLRVIKPGEAATIRKLLQSEPDALLLRNLASWLVLRETAPELPFIGDYPLNVANQLTADLLLNAGFERLTPSYDLNFDQLSSLISQSDPSRFEVTVHQYMPMFHMEHCVFCRFLSSGTDSSNCGRPCESHEVRLRDRMGYEHPVKADFGCRNTVFNAVPQTAAAYLAGMRESGIFRFRLDLLLEDREEARTTISLYRSALGAGDDHLGDAVDPASLWRRLRATSKLGVTRGSLDHTGGAEERIASEEKLYRIGHRARAVEAVSRG